MGFERLNFSNTKILDVKNQHAEDGHMMILNTGVIVNGNSVFPLTFAMRS